jgi:hypothetical protein
MSATHAFEQSDDLAGKTGRPRAEASPVDEQVDELHAGWRTRPLRVAERHVAGIAAVPLDGATRIVDAYIEALDAVPGAP